MAEGYVQDIIGAFNRSKSEKEKYDEKGPQATANSAKNTERNLQENNTARMSRPRMSEDSIVVRDDVASEYVEDLVGTFKKSGGTMVFRNQDTKTSKITITSSIVEMNKGLVSGAVTDAIDNRVDSTI